MSNFKREGRKNHSKLWDFGIYILNEIYCNLLVKEVFYPKHVNLFSSVSENAK